jgi:hypothetical protein
MRREPLIEGNLLRPAASLVRPAGSRGIHQDATHQAGTDGDELRAILPLHLPDIHQPQVHLVDERRRLQRVSVTLARHVAARETPQLAENDGQELVEGRIVALVPGEQESCDLRLSHHRTGPLFYAPWVPSRARDSFERLFPP